MDGTNCYGGQLHIKITDFAGLQGQKTPNYKWHGEDLEIAIKKSIEVAAVTPNDRSEKYNWND